MGICARNHPRLNTDLNRIDGEFTDYLRHRHTAEFTIAFYCRFLRKVARYLAKRGRCAAMLRRRDVPQIMRGCSFVSAEDLAKGARWSAAIATQLDESAFGIICLTPENWERPWVNFEAGALAKRFDQGLYTFFLGFRATDIVSPLTQFQSTHFEEEEIFKVVSSLNVGLGGNALDAAQLRTAFDAFWPPLKADLDAAAALKHPDRVAKVGCPRIRLAERGPYPEPYVGAPAEQHLSG